MPRATFIHTCLRVRDPAASERFYALLGLERHGRMNFADAYVLFLGPPGGPDVLELTVNRGHTEPYELGTGYGHLALGVPDLHATLRALAEQGVEPDEPPSRPGGRADLPLTAFVADPDGYGIELVDGGTLPTPQDPDED